MENKNAKYRVITSLFWKLLEQGGTQGVQFIVQIILARILLPEDFGIIALLTVFISIARVFVQSSFNTALIQKKNANDVDFSSVFYLNISVAIVLYISLYFSAPLIANFFELPSLVEVLRVLSLTLFFGAFNSVQNSIISRNLQFKKLFISSLGAIIISGGAGIIAAYAGYGIWALVIQQVLNQLLITLILWMNVKWRPKLVFSYERVKELFKFGWKILVSSLLTTFFENLRSLVIGKMYQPAMLGFHDRGRQFPSLIVKNINGSIQSVMLPTLASQQDNLPKVKQIMRRSIITSSFLVFPMMIGLSVIAEPLVIIILTEKWLPAVPFLQIYCLSYIFWPIHTANLQAINALGRSDIFLKLEIKKKIVELLILIITIYIGIYAIAIGAVISSILATFINAYPNRHLLNYSIKEQWQDIIPSMLLSLFMGLLISLVNLLDVGNVLKLTLQILSGIIIYISMAKVLKLEPFIYLSESIKGLLIKRSK